MHRLLACLLATSLGGTSLVGASLVGASLVGASLVGGTAQAAGCDLSQVVGYQLVGQKTIQGYLKDGRLVQGYAGCVPDRVLIFTDRTGLRCRRVVVQQATLPQAYVFARGPTDIKLCVADDIVPVAPAR